MVLPVCFGVTNESLDAVLYGINPSEGDTIFAVGGSGDQAFALLEKANNVIVVDNESSQLDWIKFRLDALKCGDISSFLEKPVFDSGRDTTRYDEHFRLRDEHFLVSGCFENLRAKCDRLEILSPMNVHTFFANENSLHLDAVYLSNILGFNWGFLSKEDFRLLENMGSSLKNNSRVYVANGSTVAPRDGKIGGHNGYYAKTDNFVVDDGKTTAARMIESNSPIGYRCNWEPTVFNIQK